MKCVKYDFNGLNQLIMSSKKDSSMDVDEKEVKGIKPFYGKTGMALDEFLIRFDNLSGLKKWNNGEKADRLLDSTTGKAFELLARVPKVEDKEEQYKLLREELRQAYGLTFERTIHLLGTRNLMPGESVYDITSDVRKYVETCLPALSEQDRSRVAALHYWKGINQTEAIKHLFGTWKQGGKLTLEDAVTLTRDCAETAESSRFINWQRMTCRHHSWRRGACREQSRIVEEENGYEKYSE